MDKSKITNEAPAEAGLAAHLELLALPFMLESYDALANQAAQKGWSHVDYLAALAQGEAGLRHDRSIKRKIRLARFPVVKTLEQFRWSWPTAINRTAVQNLFRLKFLTTRQTLSYLEAWGW